MRVHGYLEVRAVLPCEESSIAGQSNMDNEIENSEIIALARERLRNEQILELQQISQGKIPERFKGGNREATRTRLALLAEKGTTIIEGVLDNPNLPLREKKGWVSMAFQYGLGEKVEKVIENHEVMQVVFNVAGRYIEPQYREAFVNEVMTEVAKL